MSDDLRPFFHQLTDAWNSHDIDQVAPFYAPDYRGDDVGIALPQQGIDGLGKMLAYYWQAFPDLIFTLDNCIVEGERAALVWTARGTHLGRLMNIPPTHRAILTGGASILTIREGKITRAHYIWDVAGILRSIGLLPDLSPT